MTSSGFGVVPTQRHTDFTTRYRCRGADEDFVCHTHGNGISILALAPTHPIRRLQKNIKTIVWQGKWGTNDRSQQKVTGKRKKGGIILEPNAVLCQVECEDGSHYDIRSTVHGKLVEINDRLTSKPDLMWTSADWEGYIAVFSLSVRHRSLLSVSDRITEGSEAERDVAELTPIRREPELSTAAASSAAVNTAAEKAGSELGPDWRSSLEYLNPRDYLQRRAHFFVMEVAAESSTSAAAAASSSSTDSAMKD